MDQIPEGFSDIPVYGPFYILTGPMYGRQRDGRYVLGMRMEEKHRNAGTAMHGGMMCMVVDTALVWALRLTQPELGPMVTSQLAVDLSLIHI